MENRIERVFKQLRSEGRKAFVPYIMAGYPNLNATAWALKLLQDTGADIVELGVPFTDPVADGPVIQAAADEALKQGVTLKKVIQMVRHYRKEISLPIILMTYYNPVFKMGLEAFFKKAASAGVDGLIVPDLPPEEAGEFIATARKYHIATVFLLAPTSTKERIAHVVRASTGFIYYVSITGITGAKLAAIPAIKKALRGVRAYTEKPICVGFGVKTPEDARAIAEVADGVIVGSSIVKLMVDRPSALKSYLNSLREAIDEVV